MRGQRTNQRTAGSGKQRKDDGEQVVASNRKARHDYEIVDRYECGIVLTGDEVKSLRGGRASLVDAFARVRGGEVWLEGMHIPPYEQGNVKTHEPLRPRKLLLHHRQIDELARSDPGARLLAGAVARLLHARCREGGAGGGAWEAPARETSGDRRTRGQAGDRTGRRPPPIGAGGFLAGGGSLPP